MNKKAMYAISYGLFVVTARVGEKDNGCITNTVAQVTSEPNRISVAVNKSNYTCGQQEQLYLRHDPGKRVFYRVCNLPERHV